MRSIWPVTAKSPMRKPSFSPGAARGPPNRTSKRLGTSSRPSSASRSRKPSRSRSSARVNSRPATLPGTLWPPNASCRQRSMSGRARGSSSIVRRSLPSSPGSSEKKRARVAWATEPRSLASSSKSISRGRSRRSTNQIEEQSPNRSRSVTEKRSIAPSCSSERGSASRVGRLKASRARCSLRSQPIIAPVASAQPASSRSSRASARWRARSSGARSIGQVTSARPRRTVGVSGSASRRTSSRKGDGAIGRPSSDATWRAR